MFPNLGWRGEAFYWIAAVELGHCNVEYGEVSPLFTDDLNTSKMIWCRGLTYSQEGKFCIDIDPKVCHSSEVFAWVVLHEIGHLKMGHLELNPRSLAETNDLRAKIRDGRLSHSRGVGAASPASRHITQANAQEKSASQFADSRINGWLPIVERIKQSYG